MKADQVWTQKLALETARDGARLEEIRLHGDSLEELKLTSFVAAKNTDINGRMPAFMQRMLKQALTARPVPDHKLCTRCGICVKHCPPLAMDIARQKLEIEYKKCIRCFCCQELCPQGALETRQGSLLKLATYFKR